MKNTSNSIIKDKSKRKFSVSGVLEYLGVSKSGYYSWINRETCKQKIRKQEIKQEINIVYNQSHQIYGAPKITYILNSNGIKVCQKTVSNYMKEDGIRAIWIKPYIRTTIDPDFSLKLENILKRNFNPVLPNAVWVTDITYIWTLNGFTYLTSVMDLFSRKIIGWYLSNTLHTDGVIFAINNARLNRKLVTPVIIHSDRGVQFVSAAYLEATPASKFIHSYSKKGTPWDNACIEAFHSLIKREWLNRYIIKDLEHARQLIFEYIETFYNTTRIHGSCEMTSPYDYELSKIV